MTDDQLIEMAILGKPRCRDAVRHAIEMEREACAQLVDRIHQKCIDDDCDDPSLTMVAFSIRSRGESND